ncbi:hypothetical protein MTO96_051536, partial [Rhipicephalus appendiculatus]
MFRCDANRAAESFAAARLFEKMLIAYRQPKLKLWWILTYRNEGHDAFLDAYQASFSEDVEVTFSFSDSEVYRKPMRNLQELHRTIEWPGIVWFGPSARYSQLGHAWCNTVRGKVNGNLLFQWLVPSPADSGAAGHVRAAPVRLVDYPRLSRQRNVPAQRTSTTSRSTH